MLYVTFARIRQPFAPDRALLLECLLYRLLRIDFETSMCKFNKFNKFNFDITKTTSQYLISIVALLLPRVHVKIIFACLITAKSKIAIKNFLTRARQKTILTWLIAYIIIRFIAFSMLSTSPISKEIFFLKKLRLFACIFLSWTYLFLFDKKDETTI